MLPKILCLHGFAQNSNYFKNELKSLEEKLIGCVEFGNIHHDIKYINNLI
jgi:hypothetical protein